MTFVDAMSAHASRLIHLVDEVLDTSRIVEGKLTLAPKRVDLAALLGQCATQFCKTEGPEAALVSQDLQAGIWVMADAERLTQAVTALLNNACKYGQGTPVSLRATADARHAYVHVHDRGLLIAEQDLERIFERFERAISERAISGLSLGLFISRSIVEKHGGTLTVTSSPADGTLFTLQLPLIEA